MPGEGSEPITDQPTKEPIMTALPRPRENVHSRREADRLAYNDCQRAAHAARYAADDATRAGNPNLAERHTDEAARWQRRADAYWLILTGTDPDQP